MRMRSPFFRCLVIMRDHVAQDGFSLLLGQFLVFGDRRRQMLQRDGGRSRCFLRHIWPSSLLNGWETKTYQALNDSGGRLPTLFCLQIGHYLHRRRKNAHSGAGIRNVLD